MASTVIGMLLVVSTLLMNDAAVARRIVARLGPAAVAANAAIEPATTPDAAACARITQIAQRYRAGELTDRGYMAAIRRAIEDATANGDVARHATASLVAFEAGDATAGERARDGLAAACASAA